MGEQENEQIRERRRGKNGGKEKKGSERERQMKEKGRRGGRRNREKKGG